MTARRTAAALAIAGAAVAAALAWPDSAPPAPECIRAPIPPAYAVNLAAEPGRLAWRCTFPTPGRSAVVLVRAYEDGSGHGAFLDPDDRSAHR
jgi:hypothetical protein